MEKELNYSISKHAYEQMNKRKIPLDLLNEVLNNPHQVLWEDELSIYQSIIEIDKKQYLLRIFVNSYKIPNMVVTVYLTNKIDKYWRD